MSFKNYKEEFTPPAAVPLPALYNILGRADDTRDTEQLKNTEDLIKSLRTIAHSVKLQGFALVSYRFLTPYGW
jgi:predicted transcriptional regulator